MIQTGFAQKRPIGFSKGGERRNENAKKKTENRKGRGKSCCEKKKDNQKGPNQLFNGTNQKVSRIRRGEKICGKRKEDCQPSKGAHLAEKVACKRGSVKKRGRGGGGL